MRRFIMSSDPVDEEAGIGAGVGEGVEEREGTKIGVEGRDMVVVEQGRCTEKAAKGCWRRGMSRVLFIPEVVQS